MNKLSLVLGACGVIILILAIVLGFVVFPKTVDNKIKQELKLVRGSAVWNKWIDIESPVYISFNIFNVLNPDQVENGETPNLEEMGPYVYRQRRQKLDPYSDSCKETVKYKQMTTYFFDQIRSGDRTEQDLVNVINVPFIAVLSAHPSPPALVAYVLPDEPLILRNVTVSELLFVGLNVSHYYHRDLLPQLPIEFDGFRFGLYKGRNQSTDGVYEIYTAAKASHSERFGQIKTWNGASSLPYWNNTECNKLSGTDGSIFRPFLKKEDSIKIFNSDLCRQLTLTFNEEVTVKDVKGYRFTPPKEVLQGAANNPDNKCYCQKADEQECQDGVIDVSICRNKAPIMLSTPYWLDGFKGYAEPVGLYGRADRDKHETRIDIEPRTGLLLEAHKRIQVNMEVTPIPGVPQLENITSKILFPALWLDEEASICDVDVDDMKNRIDKPIRTVTIVKWVAIGVGVLLVILALAAPHACKKMKRSQSSDNMTLKSASPIS